MRLDTGGSDDYVEDRRGQGGMRMGGPRLGGGLSIGAVVVVLLSWLTGRDFTGMLGLLSGDGSAPVENSAPVANNGPITDQAGVFAKDVLNDLQKVWTQILGTQYRPTTLVLFTDETQSGCGFAESATGPFYCPGDQKVYIDLGFFDELHRRFGASGDFAQAYVLAHEVGHHIQNLLGIERQMRRAQQSNPGSANQLSVRLELQADCLAGVWGHSTQERNLLDPGDVEEGLAAAAAIGDDRLQKQATGRVSPESFTHGTSQQRVEWLRRGLEQGTVEACDTFGGR
ncbi:MAG: neutral zinc metallopeptidase [Acidobacteriota bacterium]